MSQTRVPQITLLVRDRVCPILSHSNMRSQNLSRQETPNKVGEWEHNVEDDVEDDNVEGGDEKDDNVDVAEDEVEVDDVED